MQVKTLQLLKNGVVAAFFFSLMAGLLLPVYTDEVGWRFQERAGFDGVDKLYSDMCGPNSLATPPFFMMPIRYFSAFFNSIFADPFYVRLSGVGYALFWAALLLRLIGRIADDARERSILTTISFSLMGLGVLPLLLVWSRPEQPILLATTAAITVAYLDWRKPDVPNSGAQAWWRSIFILVLGIVAISYHLKGLVLIPLFLVCLAFASRGRNSHIPRLATGAILIAASLLAAHYWMDRFKCADDPVLAAQFAQQNVGATLTGLHDWRDTAKALLGNVSLIKYFELAVPRVHMMSQWLQDSQLSLTSSETWYVCLVSAWLVSLLVSLIYFALGVFECLHRQKLNRNLAMTAFLFGSAIAWSATQIHRNVYEASFILPLVMLACLFAFAASTEWLRQSIWIASLALFLGPVSIASQILIAKTYAPSLVEAFEQKGFIKEQPFSLAVLGYAELKSDIMGAAAKCDITEKRRPSGLLVDELTYFAFMASNRPQHRLGVLDLWKGSITDPVAYLRALGSDGIIVACSSLNDDLRRRAQSQGEFCCLGPPNW